MIFDVTGEHIAELSDSDLRTVVARLAIAELRAQHCPVSCVTVGGHQDAADGGLDVRVDCPTPLPRPDFVPRGLTGFQVKKPDMPASAIREEMRPSETDILRPVIGALADSNGAYILVSAQGSVADKPLMARRDAMRDPLHDLSSAAQLHTDFYDRERVAAWVNEYPGIAAWVRQRIGRPLMGWSAIGKWIGTSVAEAQDFLTGDKACLTDERGAPPKLLSIAEGMSQMRVLLSAPRECVRLIGLSGLGKTRLVNALFESSVGQEPLDPSVAIYTDYSSQTTPSAHEMARDLVLSGQRAILVVDNCNPQTHEELVRVCNAGAGQVSLLTVEYDVGDDEPESTQVFRLQSVSTDVLIRWLEQSFPHVSQVDRRTISEFSDGNFRIARALAETVKKGETLGQLKSRSLFERLFSQRNQPDPELLRAAQLLALVYSVNGEDTGEASELALLGRLDGLAPTALFEALATLRARQIVQVRGRWRAVLPQAIANRLAALALERVPQRAIDSFCETLSARLQRSFARRVGYLHNSVNAQAAVTRWLQPEGPFGDLLGNEDGLALLTLFAPVCPEAVLTLLEAELLGHRASTWLAPNCAERSEFIALLRHLAYEPETFERAALALTRFIAAEPEGFRGNSARHAFEELFHLYLSGTQASAAQRRDFIRQLACSADIHNRRCASIALRALLVADHFSSSHSFEFGARPRTWGWHPKNRANEVAWWREAVELAVELAPVLEDAAAILGARIRGLWNRGGCPEALERAATALSIHEPWLAGWQGLRLALRFEGKAMPEPIRARLVSLIEHLQPKDLLNRARATVLNRGSGDWDITDVEETEDVMGAYERASVLAQELGCELAADPTVRAQFLPELLSQQSPPRAFECGRGLAEGAEDLRGLWLELTAEYAARVDNRNAAALGGFLQIAAQRNPEFARGAIEDAIGNAALAPMLPFLQSTVSMDEEGLDRLNRAIERGVLHAWCFGQIANGRIGGAPSVALAALLRALARLPEGVEMALDVLHMHFYCDQKDAQPYAPELIQVGRELLRAAELDKRGELRNHGFDTVLKICCGDSDGQDTVRAICANLRAAFEASSVSLFELGHTLQTLFGMQPEIALDAFLLPGSDGAGGVLGHGSRFDAPVDAVPAPLLIAWANREASLRFPLLGRALSLFGRNRSDESNEPSALYLALLEHAPDKRAFLGEASYRIHPNGWSGSLVPILIARRAHIEQLRSSPHPEVCAWAAEVLPHIDRWIGSERLREESREATFE